MALQGTIDTFPLTDVLALLASSSRSGRLQLSGDRGSGTVWIHEQAVIGGELADGRVVSPERVMFELLRFEEGSFQFDAVEVTEFPTFEAEPSSVDDCVTMARSMIAEWAEIEAVVPSIRHRVDLAEELPGTELTVDRALWRVLVLTSRSSSVADLADALGVDDYEGSALVASMVREGIVEVTEPLDIDDLLAEARRDADPDEQLRSELTGSSGAGTRAGSESEDDDVAGDGAFPDHFPIDDLIDGEGDDAETPWSASGVDDSAWLDMAVEAVPFGSEPEPLNGSAVNGTAFEGWDELVDSHGSAPEAAADDATEEVLRQMSKLSPKAAEAIAAALGTSDAAEGAGRADPALDEAGPISFLDSF